MIGLGMTAYEFTCNLSNINIIHYGGFTSFYSGDNKTSFEKFQISPFQILWDESATNV